MRVLVCGGRGFGNTEEQRKLMLDTLYKLKESYSYPYDPCGKSAKSYLEIISGMADGADAFGARFARHFNLKLHEFPADWSRYGKGAGHMRNQQMLDEGKPDVVIAFPGGKGTADMVKRARFAGVEVIEVK